MATDTTSIRKRFNAFVGAIMRCSEVTAYEARSI